VRGVRSSQRAARLTRHSLRAAENTIHEKREAGRL